MVLNYIINCLLWFKSITLLHHRPLPCLDKEISSPIKTSHWTSASQSPAVQTNQILGQVSSPLICDLERSKDFGKVSCKSKLIVCLPIGSGLREGFSSLKGSTTQVQPSGNVARGDFQEDKCNNYSNENIKQSQQQKEEENNNNINNINNGISTSGHSNQNPTYLSASDEDVSGEWMLQQQTKDSTMFFLNF